MLKKIFLPIPYKSVSLHTKAHNRTHKWSFNCQIKPYISLNSKNKYLLNKIQIKFDKMCSEIFISCINCNDRILL